MSEPGHKPLRLGLYIQDVMRRKQGLAAKNLRLAARELKAQTRRTLNRPGGGSPIRRSRPGEAPRRQSGRLRDSVVVEVETVSQKPFRERAVMYATAPYAKFLQLGTPRMAPRPFLALAWAKARPKILKILQNRS